MPIGLAYHINLDKPLARDKSIFPFPKRDEIPADLRAIMPRDLTDRLDAFLILTRDLRRQKYGKSFLSADSRSFLVVRFRCDSDAVALLADMVDIVALESVGRHGELHDALLLLPGAEERATSLLSGGQIENPRDHIMFFEELGNPRNAESSRTAQAILGMSPSGGADGLVAVLYLIVPGHPPRSKLFTRLGQTAECIIIPELFGSPEFLPLFDDGQALLVVSAYIGESSRNMSLQSWGRTFLFDAHPNSRPTYKKGIFAIRFRRDGNVPQLIKDMVHALACDVALERNGTDECPIADAIATVRGVEQEAAAIIELIEKPGQTKEQRRRVLDLRDHEIYLPAIFI